MSALSRIVIVVLVSVIFAGISGCIYTGSGSQTSSTLPADKYVAIYQEYNEEGRMVEGNEPVLPIIGPALEPFDYDGSKGLSNQYYGTDGDFQIFAGIYYYYDSPVSGYPKACFGGYSGQYPLSLLGGLTIHGIDKDGTINASYDNESVILKIGDRWQSPVQTRVVDRMFCIDEESGKEYFQIFEPARFNSTWTVENKGVFNKSNLKKR